MRNSGVSTGTDQIRKFVLTITEVSKGLDMKGGSEFGLALGGGVLVNVAMGKLLSYLQQSRTMPAVSHPPMLTIFFELPFMSSPFDHVLICKAD